MLDVIVALLRSFLSAFRSRKKPVAENSALRHQLMVIQRQVKLESSRPFLVCNDSPGVLIEVVIEIHMDDLWVRLAAITNCSGPLNPHDRFRFATTVRHEGAEKEAKMVT